MKSKNTTKKSTKPKPIRLSKDVVPLHYTIELVPDLESRLFSGTETIDLSLAKKTKTLTLHAKDLEVMDVSVVQNKQTYIPDALSYDDVHESVTFSFAKPFDIGKAKISLSFRGVLNEHMRGFYASRYHIDQKEHIMATTQFEANDARRCIPCFDEPDMKATFQVSLVIPTHKEAVSNMLPASISEHSAGYKVVSFEKTPKMSTYLLAFLVGDFEYLEHTTKKGVKVRIITTPGKKQQGKFALNVTLKCLDFYEQYFDIPYPLNTLDMIAVPDFESAAMENWGAITYRETALLVDEEYTSLSTKQHVAIVICHELAHQWFGNLVTMEWWNDLWLNEGFASYMEYVAVDHIFPNWNIWSDFLFSDYDRALRLDGMCSTHPIDVPVNDPNDIGQIFDAISYSKGASVIRQLAAYLGETHFQAGLRYYLKKHSYKNTQTIHLWEAFEKVSKKPVQHMMNIWTKKPGYPLVSVDIKDGLLSLSQKRFFQTNAQKDPTLWPVPLSLVSEKGITQAYLFDTKKTTLHNPSVAWCKINSEETGFFRVSYSDEMLVNLESPIRTGRLSEADRYGVIRDVFALTWTGQKQLAPVFSFIDAYKNETAYSIWIEIISFFNKVRSFIEGTPQEAVFKKYVQQYMNDIFQTVGYSAQTNEDEKTALLRSLILSTMVSYEHPQVIAWAKRTSTQKDIDPNIRGVVYRGLAKTNTDTAYRYLYKKYLTTDLHEEKNRILQALGLFEKDIYIEKNLKLLFSKDVRLQDSIYLFRSITAHKNGLTQAWKHMTTQWSQYKEISIARNMFSSFVHSLNGMSTEKDKKAFIAFFTKKGLQGIELAFSQTVEKIEHTIFLQTLFKKEIQKLFRQ